MSGYENLLMDADSVGKILVFTAPHIGNCGRTHDKTEGSGISASGMVVRELARRTSNHLARQSLSDWLVEDNTVAIREVDTRAVTRYLRAQGAMRGVIVHSHNGENGRAESIEKARNALITSKQAG